MNHFFCTILLLLGFLSSLLPTQAQDVSERAFEFIKKENKNGLSVVVSGQQKNVLAVLEQKFKQATGAKVKTKSGFKFLEGARYPQLSSERLDMYYTVEKVGKNDKNTSRVILFLSKGNSIFLNSSGAPKTMKNATEMLQKLGGEVEIYEMELEIAEQEKLLEKAIKEQEKLAKDSLDLEEKLATLLQQIEDNKLKKADQRKVIAEEEGSLEEARAELSATRRKHSGEEAMPVDFEKVRSPVTKIKDEGDESKEEKEKEGGGGNNN